jgi:hypothetical protein
LLRFAKMRNFSLDFLIIVAYSARQYIVPMLHAVLAKWTSIKLALRGPQGLGLLSTRESEPCVR